MIEFLMRKLLDQASWISRFSLAASTKLKEIRRNLLIALCLGALGFILVAISLVSLAVLIVMIGWQEFPILSLLFLSILYAGAGVFLIQRSIRRLC